MFDMHADVWTDTYWENKEGKVDILRNKHYDKWKQNGMIGGIFTVWTEPYEMNQEFLWKYLQIMAREIDYAKDIVKVVKTYDDFSKAKDENKLAVILGFEGLAPIEGNIDYIHLLHKIGFRHIGLTWNEENAFATGVGGDSNRGLTDLGIEAVKKIEELGILLDVSHANDKTFWEVEKIVKKPFFASHSNSRAINNHKRNLTDEQLRAIKDHGGMVGINAWRDFVSSEKENQNLENFIKHFEHIAGIVGIDKVGFGFDFEDYCIHEWEKVGTKDIEDATKFDNVRNILKNRGYSDDEIEKVSHKNFFDFVKRVGI